MFSAHRPALVALACVTALASCDDPQPEPPTPEAPEETTDLTTRYRAPVAKIVEASGEAEYAWEWLRTLCVDVGHRLSGSESLERAVAWAGEELEGIEGATVTLQEVEVPKWVRGEESLVLLGGDEEEALPMIGLGGSVGTPEEGVEGEVVVLGSLEDIDSFGDQLEGKIVLLDKPMPPYDAEELETGYGATVPIRTQGAAHAATHGAVAVLVRSVTVDGESPPHTGATHYEDEGPRIPAAAVSIPVTERLHRMIDEGAHPRVRLKMQARDEGTATSHNVIAEIRGTELPDEIVLFGGHIDSWDVGQGCHDDGAGVVSAMAALRLLKEQGLVPRRTLRAVLFTNEENGLAGGRAYAEEHWGDGMHIAAIESDIGAARVLGLHVDTEELREADAIAQLRTIVELLQPTGTTIARAGFAGADIMALQERGTPTVGIVHDPAHYFDLHHTAADTFESVDHDDFLQGVAVMAATAYVLGDMEARLGNPR